MYKVWFLHFGKFLVLQINYKLKNILISSGHKDTVVQVKFNFDGTLLATGGLDNQVLVWDVKTG